MYELPLRQVHGPAPSNSLQLYEGVRIAGRFVLGRLSNGGDDSATFESYDLERESWVRVRFRLSPTFHDLRLAHQGIGQFQDHGCVGDWYVSSLDPGEGEGLDLFVQRLHNAALEPAAVMGLGLELLELLDLPHATGAFHGNLSLDSLHVTPDWAVQVVDYPDQVSELTESAARFASPERQVGHLGDERSDVYAAAGILYTLFTGRTPFGDEPSMARHGHLYDRLLPQAELPEPLFMVLETAMAKRADHRYPTTTGMCSALRDAFMEVSLGLPDLTLEGPDFWDLPQMTWTDATLDPAPERDVRPTDETQVTADSGIPALLTQVVLGALCLVTSTLAACSTAVAFGMWLVVG